MRLAYGKAVLLLGFGVAAATFTSTFDSMGAVQRGFQRPAGEVIRNRACLGCHDLTPIRTQALDLDGWTAVIDMMIDNGAEVESEEIPVLAGYLTENHGPLPEGEGKAILLQNCTICHNLDRVKEHAGVDRGHWQDTLFAMLNEGAYLTDEDFDTLLSYLARNFGE